MPGRILGSLGIPRASLGIPWVVLGGSLGVPGMPLEVPGGSLQGPWPSLGLPRDPQGTPGTPQEPSLDASVGTMGALKNIEKPLFLLHFQHRGALGDPLGDPWG